MYISFVKVFEKTLKIVDSVFVIDIADYILKHLITHANIVLSGLKKQQASQKYTGFLSSSAVVL